MTEVLAGARQPLWSSATGSAAGDTGQLRVGDTPAVLRRDARLCLAAGPDYGLGVGVICQCAPAQISASVLPSVPTATHAAGLVHDRPAGWTYGSGCGGLGIRRSPHAAPFHDSPTAMMPPL